MNTTGIENNGIRLAGLLKADWQGDTGRRPALDQVIDRVRRRWRLRLLLNGLCWALALATATLILAAWFVNFWHFGSNAVWSFRLLTLLTLVGLVGYFCVPPLLRRVDDARVALYLEENEPSLKAILLSALDASRAESRDLSPRLVAQLVDDALEACRRVQYGYAVEQQKLRLASARLGVILLFIVALIVWPPGFLRFGAPALLMPWTGASQYSPYRIELSPGNVEIAQGSDQLISAVIDGFDGDGVMLSVSQDQGATWRQIEMTRGVDPGVYEAFLFDLTRGIDYLVDGAGQRSASYRIDVAAIPAIDEIGLRYHYPAYTMLPPETSLGSGDITALRDTRVEVRIVPTIDIPGGQLLFDDGRSIELVERDGEWVGELTVGQNGIYRVRLQRASGVLVDASPEYRVTVLDDGYPSVSIKSPGRDTKVSMIEEPLMQIRANDDQGIASLDLVLSINGEDEQRIRLMPAAESPADRQQVEAEHIVYLEDLELRPGDLISYYVQAGELAPEGQVRTATSDIFFYQVRPFSTNYRSADQQGGGGGGGGQGGQQQEFLSEQQKQFVVATFKMIRDRDNYDAETYRQNLELLATAEARIRDRVEAIVRRIGGRPVVQQDERYRIVTEELPLAAEAMIEVENKLKAGEIDTALSDAQVALKHLQRADAAFRDINLSLANRGGGGAGNNTGNEDLADLFRLEMDKLRNQYETVQRGQQQSAAEQVIDETLERLRELARRQQQEVERRMRGQQQASGNASDERQLALAEQLEEMARQLERLTREQANPQVQQSIDQMREAAQAMRRNAASAGGGTADQARQAAAGIREAQRLLDQSRVAEFGEKIERSLRRAERIEKKQAAIKEQVTRLEEGWSDRLKARLQRLEESKQDLSGELSKLEAELGELTGSAREHQPQVGEPLKQAIGTSREYRLHERIGRTRQMILLEQKQHAIDNEAEIQRGIAQIREHIESARANVGEPNARGLERSLEQMRALTRELRVIRERSAAAADQGGTAVGPGGGGLDAEGIIWRELEGIAERAGELGGRLVAQGVSAGDIDPVLEKINELAGDGDGGRDSLSTQQQDLALRALMELEYRLRGLLNEAEVPELLVSGSTELPDEYRAMVADYFRELSAP
ncbi:MAG: hypothetical protein OEO18_14420 [Gammaproteobacteria bacterium]|nr:hypothetical protein [Gammaproteobacteria bacterium]